MRGRSQAKLEQAAAEELKNIEGVLRVRVIQ